MIRAGVERGLARVWTAIPVIVTEDTAEGHIVKVQPVIKGKQTDQQGKQTDIEPPVCTEVPIQFSSGGGFTITHPIKKGDEGIAVFGARCIDGWWDKGGLQPQLHGRRHNLSDAMYIPGIRSKPRKLGGDPQANGQMLEIDLRSDQTAKVSLGTLQIRTDKGDCYIELTGDSVNIIVPNQVNITCKDCNVSASDKVTITSPTVDIEASGKVHVNSPMLEVTGEITAGGDVIAGFGVPSSSSAGAQPLSGAGGLPSTPGAAVGAVLSDAEQAMSVWNAIHDGSFQVSINGALQQITGLDFHSITDLNGVASTITNALSLTGASMNWQALGQSVFALASGTVGVNSAVSLLSAIPGVGTDISRTLKMAEGVVGAFTVAGKRGSVSLLEHLHQLVRSGLSNTGEAT